MCVCVGLAAFAIHLFLVNETSALLTKQKIKEVNSTPQKQFVSCTRTLVKHHLRDFLQSKEEEKAANTISCIKKIIIAVTMQSNGY